MKRICLALAATAASALTRAATAAGTTCTFAEPPPGFPNTLPVVVVNG